jgi:4-diphosphocytidyl-2-C-methyl-D-erythritol kinase
LEVLGKRRDGYHDLETLMVTVNLYDTLCFKEGPSAEVSFSCESVSYGRSVAADRSLELPGGHDNLVVRALEMLRREVGIDRGVAIRLRKRIPVGAGLGGGSSDAAAALAGLNRWWNLGLSVGDLSKLAAQLGSDVPFFLHAPSAVCRGRGERVEPIRLPGALHFVIACPLQGLSTARVFAACEPPQHRKGCGGLLGALRTGRMAAAGRGLLNRLYGAASQSCEELGRARRSFARQAFLGHQMSGSGSAYFGLCRDRRQARTLAGRLSAEGMRIFCVRSSP